MENNILMIRTLVDRFFGGSTTLSEEQQLYSFFLRAEELPADLERLRPMFIDLSAVSSMAADPLPEAKPEPLAAAATPPRPARRSLWVAAAAIAVAVAGGALWLSRRQPSLAREPEEELVVYLYGQRVTDRSLVLSEMHRTMAAVTVPDGSDEVEQQLKAMFDN